MFNELKAPFSFLIYMSIVLVFILFIDSLSQWLFNKSTTGCWVLILMLPESEFCKWKSINWGRGVFNNLFFN